MCNPRSFRAVIEHFQRNGWDFDIDRSRPIILTRFKGQNGNFECVIALEDSDQLLHVVSITPLTVPQHKRASVGEFCVRFSHKVKMGRFDLNYESGQFSFHTYSYYPGDLSDELILRVLGTNLITVDHQFPLIIRVVYGDLTPAEAVNVHNCSLSKINEVGFQRINLSPVVPVNSSQNK